MSNWKNWGDHPIPVALGMIASLCGILAFISTVIKTPAPPPPLTNNSSNPNYSDTIDPESAAQGSTQPSQTTPSDREEILGIPEVPGLTTEATVLITSTPEKLTPYVGDFLKLGLIDGTLGKPSSNEKNLLVFRGNEPITRAVYAELLITINNYFHKERKDFQVRQGEAGSASPVFLDVPWPHPQYYAIQGLAESGVIPSPLTGSSTTVTFRPDESLTRSQLLLWKVPLDTRQPLPNADSSIVERGWGFKDADAVEPRALQAILADGQLGEFSNIRRSLGYTNQFRPNQPVTKAEAVASLWRFGNQTDGITAADMLLRQGE